MAGVLKSSHTNLDNLYKNAFTGVEFFRTKMSINRLRFLWRCIRFHDKDTRNEKCRLEKLAPIHDMFEQFNCTQHYSTDEHA